MLENGLGLVATSLIGLTTLYFFKKKENVAKEFPSSYTRIRRDFLLIPIFTIMLLIGLCLIYNYLASTYNWPIFLEFLFNEDSKQ